MKQEKLLENSKPPFKLILEPDGNCIVGQVERILSAMIYAKGYYHLFDGRYIVESWEFSTKDDTLIIESMSLDGCYSKRIDRVGFEGVLDAFMEVIDDEVIWNYDFG